MSATKATKRRRVPTAAAGLRVIDGLPVVHVFPVMSIKAHWQYWSGWLLHDPAFLAGLAARGISLRGTGRWAKLVRSVESARKAIEAIQREPARSLREATLRHSLVTTLETALRELSESHP